MTLRFARPLALAALTAVLLLAPAADAQATFTGGLNYPWATTQLQDGRILFAESNGNRVSAYSPDGTSLGAFAGITFPTGVMQLADGRVLVSARGSAGNGVYAYQADGTPLGAFALTGGQAEGVLELLDGTVLVTGRGMDRIDRHRLDGTLIGPFAAGLSDPKFMVQLFDGRILATVDRQILAFGADGSPMGTFAGGLGWLGEIIQIGDGRVLAANCDGGPDVYAFGPDGTAQGTFYDGSVSCTFGLEQLLDSRVLLANYNSGNATTTTGPAPPAACTLEAPLSFDVDGSGRPVTASDFNSAGTDATYGEFAGLRNETVDTFVEITGCSFVAFDPFTEKVTYALDASGFVDPTGTHVFSTTGGDQAFGQADVLFDNPGAFALVMGPATVGQDVTAFRGRVVAAVVYDRDRSVFGSIGGNATPAEREAFALAMADAFGGGAVASEGDGALDLAVRAQPNPASGRGAVSFGLAEAGDVSVALYDALGREVAVLAEGARAAGRHEVALDAAALPTGVYVVRVVAGGAVRTARLTVAR